MHVQVNKFGSHLVLPGLIPNRAVLAKALAALAPQSAEVERVRPGLFLGQLPARGTFVELLRMAG